MKPQRCGQTEGINCRPSPALIGRPSRERILDCVLRYAREGAITALSHYTARFLTGSLVGESSASEERAVKPQRCGQTNELIVGPSRP